MVPAFAGFTNAPAAFGAGWAVAVLAMDGGL